jgi:hypothetical protein
MSPRRGSTPRLTGWLNVSRNVTLTLTLLGSLIALMMEAARTSETWVDIQLRTRQYIPENSEFHTRRRENLKSHKFPESLNSIAMATVITHTFIYIIA